MKKVKLVLIGYGRIGKIHFQNIISDPSVELAAVIESERQSVLFTRPFDYPVYTSLESYLYQNSSIPEDQLCGVIISTPTPTHHDLTKLALNHRLAVFCEKPLSTLESEIKHLFSISQTHHLPLFCAFHRRFDPSFLELKRSILNNYIGRIHYLHSVSRDHPFPPLFFLSSSGGIFQDCCVHDIDMHCWLLNEYPSRVYVSGKAWHPDLARSNDFDSVVINLEYPSGVTSVIHVERYASYGYDQRVEVFGEDGMLCVENPHQNSLVKYHKESIKRSPLHPSFEQRYSAAYKAEMSCFINMMRNASNEDMFDDEYKQERNCYSCQDPIHCAITKDEIVRNCVIAEACAASVRLKQAVTIHYELGSEFYKNIGSEYLLATSDATTG
ncbi:inositol 2-dehydrogenase-like [Schistocerca gregaria]|uniref:inositol 2-dehydrogenase-like n=1 Tax=Schistocerca gregaria TaxID=7010 RepID=UPI00211E4389|nr:inositol 2-dehydrogenase-like [Schistocerca gregaria]